MEQLCLLLLSSSCKRHINRSSRRPSSRPPGQSEAVLPACVFLWAYECVCVSSHTQSLQTGTDESARLQPCSVQCIMGFQSLSPSLSLRCVPACLSSPLSLALSAGTVLEGDVLASCLERGGWTHTRPHTHIHNAERSFMMTIAAAPVALATASLSSSTPLLLVLLLSSSPDSLSEDFF